MSGIPCDLLVDIDGPQDCYVNSSNTFRNSVYSSGYDDDPFELCSMHVKNQERNLDIELGLALEKSLKLCSHANYRNSPATGSVKSSSNLDLGILVNLDESPDKKLIEVPLKDPDTVFTHTPSNPFEMAWDVIEQEALTLANHIEDDEEKTISPRKMVDLAMRLSPDSMLLSPRNDVRDIVFLINSSPECEPQTVPKSVRTSQFRGRSSSVASSPVVTKSHITPSRSRRPSFGGASPLSKTTKKKLIMPSPSHPNIAGASPLSKSIKKLTMPLPSAPTIGGASPLSKPNHKVVLPSPANPAVQKPTFRTPLFRSASTTIPSHHVSSFKPTTKAVPMKAVHHGPTAISSSSAKPPAGRPITGTPVRRSITPLMTPKPPPTALPPPSTAAPSSTPAFLSKLRAPLTRTESEIPQPTSTKIPNFQRQGSLRYVSKRTSLNTLSNTTSAALSRFGILSRLKPKGRENTEP